MTKYSVFCEHEHFYNYFYYHDFSLVMTILNIQWEPENCGMPSLFSLLLQKCHNGFCNLKLLHLIYVHCLGEIFKNMTVSNKKKICEILQFLGLFYSILFSRIGCKGCVV